MIFQKCHFDEPFMVKIHQNIVPKIQSGFYQPIISFYTAIKSEIDIFQIIMITRVY